MKKIKLTIVILFALITSCAFFPEADIRITGWTQTDLGSYFGLVEITYEVENIGGSGINDFDIRFIIECTDSSSYSATVERVGHIGKGETFTETIAVDVYGKEASQVTVVYTSYH